MIKENKWIVVGIIASPHGINGKVKVKSLSDFEERFLEPGLRWLQKDNEFPAELELQSGYRQPGKETFIVSFKSITSRNDAEKLKNHKILVKTDDVPILKKDEFHLVELVNLEVKLSEEDKFKIIGKVIGLLVVELSKNQKKVLIPFVKEIVPLIDLKNNFIIITPPKGLLEL